MLDTSDITLQAAGLIALADLPPIVVRTALAGTASYYDALVIAPGMHHQQAASEINRGEFPITGAMTTGYIFRVENPATVHYLQSVGVAGHLVTAHVYPRNDILKENTRLQSFVAGVPASLLYALCPILTIMAVVSLAHIRDWWALGVLGGFVVSRLINVVVIKRRDERGWKGQKEPGVHGDLLILLCHDRWVRLQGAVDDLKAVTSGQWLRDMTAMESFAVTCATMLVYASAALAFNASTTGSMLIAFLLLSTAALLTLCNSSTQCLQIYDRVIRTVGGPKKYERRLALANELIAEAGGRDDWAIGMGLVLPKFGEAGLVNV
ncbi:hypothetical protein EDD18DRAFT_513530 [Armillaria luteobubalina]|uniref:Uncharacterized protein n=1 Tax=Armillaria luteobubalina TaxID=153913 RepID=A0AA39UJV4_9AGAR|nr:hypothetical protein EDD18DRAFT_513530 [Armillaria luteobubalina]